MDKIFEILLTQGGLLGALLVLALVTVAWQEKRTEALRRLQQETIQAERAAGQARESVLQAKLDALHEKHKADLDRFAAKLSEQAERVHDTVDRVSELLEHTRSSRRTESPPYPPPRPTTGTRTRG